MKLLVRRQPLLILRTCESNNSAIIWFEILPRFFLFENFSGPLQETVAPGLKRPLKRGFRLASRGGRGGRIICCLITVHVVHLTILQLMSRLFSFQSYFQRGSFENLQGTSTVSFLSFFFCILLIFINRSFLQIPSPELYSILLRKTALYGKLHM